MDIVEYLDKKLEEMESRINARIDNLEKEFIKDGDTIMCTKELYPLDQTFRIKNIRLLHKESHNAGV